jgi:hypothetical protein
LEVSECLGIWGVLHGNWLLFLPLMLMPVVDCLHLLSSYTICGLQRTIMASSTVSRKVSSVSFHPYTNKRLCTSGDGEMLLWTVEEVCAVQIQLCQTDVASSNGTHRVYSYIPDAPNDS